MKTIGKTSKTIEKARFDTRLTKEQKTRFEYAAKLGGFRSLTDFIIISVNEKAKSIINEYNTVLASDRDREVFFKALKESPKPNQSLKNAAAAFRVAIGK